jgi:Flp pilus assembly protein TadB
MTPSILILFLWAAFYLIKEAGKGKPNSQLLLCAFFPGYYLISEILLKFVKKVISEKREAIAFREDFAQFIDDLSAGTSAGRQLVQALTGIDTERLRSKIVISALCQVKGSLQAGKGFQFALLQELEENHEPKQLYGEIQLLFKTLSACHCLGASISKLLSALREQEMETSRLKRKVLRETAQVRFQGLVLCLSPLCLVTLYCVFSSEKFAFFFGTWAGRGVLGIVLCLTAMGAYVANKILGKSLSGIWGS